MVITLLFLIGCLTLTQTAPEPQCTVIPGSPLDAVACCGFPEVELDSATMSCMHDIDWDETSLMAACVRTILSLIHFHTYSTFFQTLHDCHATKSNIVNGDEVNKTALLGYVAAVFKEHPNWIEITTQAFDNCLENFLNKKADIMSVYESAAFDIKSCNPTAMSIETCSFLHVFQNCPAAAWTESDHCLEWKNYAQNCAFDPNAIIKLNDVSMDDLKEEVFV